MPDQNPLRATIQDPDPAGTGTMASGTVGWLLSAGEMAVPGLGLFLAAGPLMAVLPRWARAAAGF